MVDWRALAAATLTTLSVFTFLALPLLRELYGPEVLLGFYGLVSLAVGATMYLVIGRTLQRLHNRGTTSDKHDALDADGKTDADAELEEADVKSELETLRQEDVDDKA